VEGDFRRRVRKTPPLGDDPPRRIIGSDRHCRTASGQAEAGDVRANRRCKHPKIATRYQTGYGRFLSPAILSPGDDKMAHRKIRFFKH
jgi:hypothetical protein